MTTSAIPKQFRDVTFADLNGDDSVDETEILQQNHYYPFGMNMEGAWSGGTNKYQFNGKFMEAGAAMNTQNAGLGMEYISDFGLEVNIARFRTYDPSLGRFWQVDPFAEKFTPWTPYKFGMDNPFLYADPNGDCETCKKVLAYAMGAANAIAANMAGDYPGQRRDPNELGEYAEYAAAGQTAGDLASVAIGAGEMALSTLGLMGEGLLTVPSGGLSAGAMAPTAAVGLHGLMTGKNGWKNFMSSDDGKIYEVPGDATDSGKPYVGRTKQETPEKRGQGANDGRDRSKAKVIDTYDSSKKGQGAYKEQKAIDQRGGIDNLDNKRNERTPEKMKELEKKYGNGN